jgi:glycosyltransferase involved in cell wall biosynthesis
MLALSVIIPTRNRLPTIGRAVKSALFCRRADIEVVVVDDGSTDGTSSYLADIGDPRLRVEALASTGNANRARNIGAGIAQGAILAFLDSDDVYGVGRIDRLIAFFGENPGVDCLVDGYVDISRREKRIHRLGITAADGGKIRRMLLAHLMPLTNSAISIRRAAFEAIGGYDEKMPRHQDRELLLRVAANRRLSFGQSIDVEKYRARNSISHEFDGYVAGLDALVARCPDYHLPENVDVLRYLVVRGILKAVNTGHWIAAVRELRRWQAAQHLPKDILKCLLAYPEGRRQRRRQMQEILS